MRRAFQNKKLLVENEVFLGVSLGWDYCAEHEWGIEKMRNHFGIDKSKMGVDSRTISKGEVLFKEDKNLCVFTSRKPYGLKDDYKAQDLLSYEMKGRDGYDLECAWDEGDFCISTTKKETFHLLRELYEAFQKYNGVICFMKSELPVFCNSSLCVLIKDRIPEKAKEEMYLADKEYKDLIEYEKEIGVTDLKEKAKGSGYKGDKYFVACSPRWIDYGDAENREKRKKELNTKYDIQFWINYSDNDDNYGWYLAEEIIKWLSTPGLKLTQIRKAH